MVTQVPVVGILMIVNGSLTIFMGLLLMGMAPFMYYAVHMGPRGGRVPQEEQTVMLVMSVVYLVLGVLVFTSAVANVMGGIRALSYRSRTLVLVALFSNIVPLFTCYCAFTSMGVMIYGLIVLFQTDVIRAFAMGESGVSADEIKRELGDTFRRSYRDRYGRDDGRDDDDDRDDRDRDRGNRDREDRPRLPPPRSSEPPDEGIRAD